MQLSAESLEIDSKEEFSIFQNKMKNMVAPTMDIPNNVASIE